VRFLLGLFWLVAAWGFQSAPAGRSASVEERTHSSQVLGGARTYRVYLPPAYAGSQKRYPVIYWLYGYEPPNQERDSEITSYLGSHDLIVVYVGPVETSGNYPQYFPELVDHVDHSLRTMADRDHRAVTGYALGGFLALYTAGKYPDLVGSASSFLGLTESPVGPKRFEDDYRLHELYRNYDGVRTRLVADPREPLHFYHQRLNAIWSFARQDHESGEFDRQHATEAIPQTFDFHLRAFTAPLPKPAVFSHADAYPNFTVWGWEVASNRRQPGFTVLDHVSAQGFRSAVREWAPGGSAIPAVKLSIASARLYVPGSSHQVTDVRVRDGHVRHVVARADAQGRLNFELDGEEHEVGIAEQAAIMLDGWQVDGAAWASAGQPVKLQVRFRNVGAARSATSTVRWETPNPGVQLGPASSRLFGLASGEAAPLPLVVTVTDPQREIVQIAAMVDGRRLALEVPLFPPAQSAANYQIADGRVVTAYHHANEPVEIEFGKGNGDGQPAPGESFVVLLPDAGALRAAEVFTNDPCVETGQRASDSWDFYDRQLASFPYSVWAIQPDCEPGHVVHALARVVSPGGGAYQVRYAAIEFSVWWRPGQEPHVR